MYKNNGEIIVCGDTIHPENIMTKLFSGNYTEIFTIHDRFTPQQKNFIFISDDTNAIKTCDSNYPGVKTVYAETIDDQILLENGIKSAMAIIISYEDDRENLLITLSTRQLNPYIKIIVTCSMIETMRPKLLLAGANSIISPSIISSNKMAAQLIRPTTTEFIDSFLHRDDNHFSAQEIYITATDQNNDVAIIDSEYAKANLLILAISRDNTEKILYNPPSNYLLHEGDILLVLGTIPNFQKLSPYTQYHLKDYDIDKA